MKNGSLIPIYNDGLDSSLTPITSGTMQASVLCLDGENANKYFNFDSGGWQDELFLVTIPYDGTRGFVIGSALGNPGPGVYQIDSSGSEGDATNGVPQKYFLEIEGTTQGYLEDPSNTILSIAGYEVVFVKWNASTISGRPITAGDAVCTLQQIFSGAYWDGESWGSYTELPLALGSVGLFSAGFELTVGGNVAYPILVRAWGTSGHALEGVPRYYIINRMPDTAGAAIAALGTKGDSLGEGQGSLGNAILAGTAGIAAMTPGVGVTGGSSITSILNALATTGAALSGISTSTILISGSAGLTVGVVTGQFATQIASLLSGSTAATVSAFSGAAQSTMSALLAGTASSLSSAELAAIASTVSLATSASNVLSALGIFTGGVGLYGVTATLADSAGTKIANATFQLNSTGGDVVAWDLSDANGLAITHVNTGSYTLSIAKPGQYTFGSSGQSIAISGNTAVSYVGVAFDPGAPTDPSRCNVYAWISKAGAAVSGVIVEAELVADYGTSGDWLEVPIKVSATTSTAGYAVLTLLRSQTYRYTVQGTNIREEIAVPNAASVNVITKF